VVYLQPAYSGDPRSSASVAETIRRWGAWFVYAPNYFDDVSIGAFLLFGAWLSARKPAVGQRYLAAAWGYTCGLGYASVFGHLASLRTPDVSQIPHIVVFSVINAGWLLGIAALLAALRPLQLAEQGNTSKQQKTDVS
jgi:hypothetical protein